jgi:hypothetical protein
LNLCSCRSQVGRCVLQAHLEWDVDLAVGIELAASRHARALKALRALDELTSRAPAAGGRVLLQCGDMLRADLSAATVVWCAALLFSEDFMRSLAAKLAACPRLR